MDIDIDKLTSRIKERQTELEPIYAEAQKAALAFAAEITLLASLADSLDAGSISVTHLGLVSKLLADPVSAPPVTRRIRQNEPGSKAWKEGEIAAKVEGASAINPHKPESIAGIGWQGGYDAVVTERREVQKSREAQHDDAGAAPLPVPAKRGKVRAVEGVE